MIDAMKQALEALKRLHDIDGMYSWVDTEQALRQAIEQAEKQFNPDWDQQAVLVERIRELEAQQALDKKADNARKLGLDYEPEPVAWVCEGFGKEKHNLDYVQEDIDALEIGTALYTAPPQAENQEPDLPPVGIGVDVTAQGATVVGFYRRPNAVSEQFYSEFHPAPPHKEWVGLTDEEIVTTLFECEGNGIHHYTRTVEAKLKEKNT